jgi:hypothetical protein
MLLITTFCQFQCSFILNCLDLHLKKTNGKNLADYRKQIQIITQPLSQLFFELK